MKLLAAFASFLLLASASAQGPVSHPSLDTTPRIGILIPKGPPDYALLLDALQQPAHVHDGVFDFETGTIADVPVVLIVQPAAGEVLRSLVAMAMMHDFNVRLLLYPGTSGGHLPKGEMAPGDIVLGAKNVDHGNYYLSPDGRIEAGEFAANMPGERYAGPLYASRALLPLLACSASRVAAHTTLPAYVAPVRPDAHPQVFYFGIQGTSTVWSDNKTYTEATMRVFHEIDEDGDWYSNLAATLNRVPFLEVSVISNSIFAFPNASHGTPATPAGEASSHVLAQRISNRIVLDLIRRNGRQLLASKFDESSVDPWPSVNYTTPRDPKGLLEGCRP